MSRVNLSLAEYRDLAKTGKVVPLALTMEGDLETPINLFLKLCSAPNSYLLESVTGGEKWGRYSYIGRNPVAVIKAHGSTVTIAERSGKIIQQQGEALQLIEDYLARYQAVSLPNLPDFTGGAIGQISYDYAAKFGKNNGFQFPEIHLLVFDQIIAYDHLKQNVIVIQNVSLDGDLEANYTQALRELTEVSQEIMERVVEYPFLEQSAPQLNGKLFSNETKESFMKKVIHAKQYIEKGVVSQVVLSQQFGLQTSINPFTAYRKLRSINPSPYLFYIDYGDYQLVGSSPELLVKVKDNLVETCPIAGTRPRGRTEAEDEAYAAQLLADQKELAEHLMLVELGKADLEKIARPGSVKTTKYLAIEKYSHVMHMVSHLVGELQANYTMFDAIEACLPAGTVSGSPKEKAMEIIAQLENHNRGIYAGAVGYLGFNGNMDLCITIRTLLFHQGKAYVQAGAGIVADSVPEKEYEETMIKARALLTAINS
ncbi:MAG: anthranilate synthase component I [Firmicutes bacterium]|nr:anthranilate synthase component I [Bacillota bacterium]